MQNPYSLFLPQILADLTTHGEELASLSKLVTHDKELESIKAKLAEARCEIIALMAEAKVSAWDGRRED